MARSSGAKPRGRAARAKAVEETASEAVEDEGGAAAEGNAGAVKDEGGGPRSGNVLRKKSLIDAVAKSTGAKKKVAKDVVDAVLSELSAAISRGDDLVLPPLGRGRVLRQRETGGGEMFVLRFRKGGAKGEGGEAEAGEADMADETRDEAAAT